ncbi:hypothetical protein [Streptomyces violens]|uniref:hypothetical protein n=1 Tax=Streptomyces violens TaxID=66377 RepID=UPI0004C04CCE|nr:hypothetical protein [Streptomyces violens]
MLYDEVTKLGYGNARVLHNRIAASPGAHQRRLADNWVSFQRYWSQKHSPAEEKADRARAAANAAKQRAIAAAKELAQVAMDELRITDALDCFTTGSLGVCGATALTIATSFVGGLVGKFATKYGLPWKWSKAVALGKRVWGPANAYGAC